MARGKFSPFANTENADVDGICASTSNPEHKHTHPHAHTYTRTYRDPIKDPITYT